ncbi:MAG TPA: hypothetical protein H9717_13415 [Candidatus Eisenbergiella merdipullorum]|uniref:Uncharacterized protein n=1 Tax=Candidatus Eisenbergiella merdipullorum TaxID=2838553 RepID=A0A9D2I9M7_9FIRM|nr:hypothetical protein [Candidatus Eisenbergiella merdipullorum]
MEMKDGKKAKKEMGKRVRSETDEIGNLSAPGKHPEENRPEKKRTAGKWLQRLCGWALLCLAAPALTLVFLLAVSRITRELILDHVQESIEWLTERGADVYFWNGNDRGTAGDYYIDGQWLDIALYLDEGEPVETVVDCPYYLNENGDMYVSLTELAEENGEISPNTSYARYWNGSAGMLRLLLLFWDLQGIFRFQSVVGLALLAVLSLLLWRKGEVCFLIALLAALWCTNAGMISANAFCAPSFLIMAGVMILVLLKEDARLAPLFLISGSLTACFENLCAETLTISMPLLLAMVLARRRGELLHARQFFRYAIRSCLLWGAGYLSAFLAKWALSLLVLGPDSLREVAESAEYRLFLDGSDTLGWLLGGILSPFTYLRPFSFTETWGQLIVALLAVALPVFCLLYLFGKRDASCTPASLFLIPAMIPILRFVVLYAHTYGHRYAVYRALLVLVVSLLCLFLESLRLPSGRRLNRKTGR